MVESPGNLALPNNGNLMVVCPRGGCSASLDADQSRHFNWLHGALCCVVRKCEASKRAVTADPLLLKFSSDSCVETLYAVVAFSTRAWPMDIVLLRLEKVPGDSEDGPYKLRLKHGVGSHALVAQEDIAFCMSLATRAVDWTIGQLLLGDIGERLDQFDVHAEQPFSKEDLDGMQRKMKEEQLAQRAARIAQGLKRKGGSQGKKPGGNKARRKGKATDKVEEWNLEKGSDSERDLEKDVIFSNFSDLEEPSGQVPSAAKLETQKLPYQRTPRFCLPLLPVVWTLTRLQLRPAKPERYSLEGLRGGPSLSAPSTANKCIQAGARFVAYMQTSMAPAHSARKL